MSLLRIYLRALEKFPFATQSISTGVLCGTGDAISQLAVEKSGIKKYDAVRTVRFATYGLFIIGPALRTWYIVLDRFVKASTAQVRTIKMMVVDQGVFAPSFLAFFISSMAVYQGSTVEGAKEKLKADYKGVLLNNYKLWPAVQLLNFYFVPLQHRILVVNTVALGWNTYLAYVSQGKQKAANTTS